MSTLKTHNLQSPDSGSVNIALASNAGMVVAGVSTFNAGVGIGDSIFHLGDENTSIRFPAADTISFETSGGERLRIDSRGDVYLSESTSLSSPFSSFHHLSIGNNLILNGRTDGTGGFAGMQHNAYLNSSGNWERVYNDHATSIGTDNGNFYFRNTGAGTGNISWSSPLTITSTGELTSTAAQANVATFTSNQTASTIYVKDTDGDGIFISGSSAYGHRIYTNTTEDLLLGTNSTERFRITSDGDIYGPSAGRKNWFDNGSFDCTYGGRKANVSMDYGNHHAYGWVTDRFMSRNAVQWSRSSNVPTGKGFSYSTLTNGAGGILMQAVELPDYGDMGVFTPGSYWCVSFWSTAPCNPSAAAFSYDLGSTKTDMIVSMGGTYDTTGETAAGTSTGTFNRYYKVFQMPSSIISTAIAAYWQWGFSQQGYATGFQLERVPTSTSKPTPYEHVHPSVTIARCRRYAYRVYNSRHVTGWKRHDAGVNWEAKHPVLPTHMPSGSNQSADPYGIILHTAGTFTNFQSVWQNPAITSLSRYGFNPSDGSFIVNGQSNYSGSHVVIPSWEAFEYEVQHGFF